MVDWDRDRDACVVSEHIPTLSSGLQELRRNPFDMHCCRNPEEDA